ncbi:MAG: methyltransferase domain-containing protein [Planctomycetales bacterium]|nr:methyltransferase domain-containing protein [Planctomycetales bacterium]
MNECASCGRAFDERDGLLDLMTRQTQATVTFRMGQEVNVATYTAGLNAVLREPPVSRCRVLPYHLDPAHARVLETLPAGATVLEIGCGGGQARPWLQERGIRYVGVDVSKERVFDWLKDFGGPDLLCDAHRLPFKPAAFDAVYCAAVFEHLACPAVAAQEIRRVLKPGGVFLGNCAFLEPWHDSSYFHASPAGVFALLSQTGFATEYIWPGRGYSGFRAIMVMSGWLMNKFRWIGSAIYGMYRLENVTNAYVRKTLGRPPRFSDIEKRARVAGAVDWIARVPQFTGTATKDEQHS